MAILIYDEAAAAKRELRRLAMDIAGWSIAQKVDYNLVRAEMNGLLAAADAFVSLHRSEGFGFGLGGGRLRRRVRAHAHRCRQRLIRGAADHVGMAGAHQALLDPGGGMRGGVSGQRDDAHRQHECQQEALQTV